MTQQQASDMLVDITRYLNDIIIKTGKPIQQNNTALWDRYFHKWSNDDWDLMLTALEELQRVQPILFKPFHNEAIREARKAWHKQRSKTDRIMDRNSNKTRAWRTVMTIREIVNAINGVDIPNEEAKVVIRTEPQETIFGRLFTQ